MSRKPVTHQLDHPEAAYLLRRNGTHSKVNLRDWNLTPGKMFGLKGVVCMSIFCIYMRGVSFPQIYFNKTTTHKKRKEKKKYKDRSISTPSHFFVFFVLSDVLT